MPLALPTDGGPLAPLPLQCPFSRANEVVRGRGRLAAFSNWDRFFTVPADQHTSTLSSLSSDRPHYVTEYDLTYWNQDGVRVVCASLLEREKCSCALSRSPLIT